MNRDNPAQGTVRQAFVSFMVMITGSTVVAVVVMMSIPGANFGDSSEVPLSDPMMLLGLTSSSMIGFAVALTYAVRCVGWRAFRFGPVPGRHLRLALGMTIPVLIIGFIWTALLESMSGAIETQEFVEAFLDCPDPAVAGIVGVYAILGAAFLEEGLFRGFIQPALVARWGRWTGIVVTSVTFGLIHGTDPWSVVPVFIIGMFAGWLREHTGRLGASIIFHGSNNLLALVLTALPFGG